MNVKKLTIYLLILIIQILALMDQGMRETWHIIGVLLMTNILAELVYKIMR